MTALPDRAALIEQIAALPQQLAALVADMPDAHLDRHSLADPWTIRQLVHHVADSHLNAFIRTKLMLTEEHPTLKPYDQDLWVTLADSNEVPVGASLAILTGLHARWVALFRRLDDRDWQRAAFHPEHGTITVHDQLTSYAAHGRDHITQIERIRQHEGW